MRWPYVGSLSLSEAALNQISLFVVNWCISVIVRSFLVGCIQYHILWQAYKLLISFYTTPRCLRPETCPGFTLWTVCLPYAPSEISAKTHTCCYLVGSSILHYNRIYSSTCTARRTCSMVMTLSVTMFTARQWHVRLSPAVRTYSINIGIWHLCPAQWCRGILAIMQCWLHHRQSVHWI
jgi:hypothetical protein